MLRKFHQYIVTWNIYKNVNVEKFRYLSYCCSAGLQPGDVVTHANGNPVVNSSNIYKILEQPGTIKLQVVRKGKVLYITVEPEDM